MFSWLVLSFSWLVYIFSKILLYVDTGFVKGTSKKLLFEGGVARLHLQKDFKKHYSCNNFEFLEVPLGD